MTFEQIMAIVVAAAPSIASIVGIVVSAIKLIKSGKATNQEIIDKFEEVRVEVSNTKDYSQLKDQLLICMQENAELKKTINELLTKIDHIYRGE